MSKHLQLVAIATCLGVGLMAGTATASGGTAPGGTHFTRASLGATADVSSNWAGYAVLAPSTTYTSVTGTWKQPKATCTAGNDTSAAFWVGLGGYSETSEGLEQIGTAADCASDGTVHYYAWYELVPAESVTVKFVVAPGDTITTSVNVLNGTTIELQIKNRTKHTTFTRKLQMAAPDLSSAEWIAEAPSLCNGQFCRTQPLTNFGTVSFSKVAAIGNTVGGTLTNPAWTATTIDLVADHHRGFYPGSDQSGGGSTSTIGATPSSASVDGRAFTVNWLANASA